MEIPESTDVAFVSALSTAAQTSAAVEEVCRLASRFPSPPDLGLLFVSSHHRRGLEETAGDVLAATGVRHVLGCTAEAVVATGREIERKPAMALWLARLPGATLCPMHLEFQPTAEGVSFTGWPDDVPQTEPGKSLLLMLADPFSFPADALLCRLNEDRPQLPVVGGMASGGNEPGQNRLVLGPQILDSGAVAILLHGSMSVQTVVSQGCRPIGKHFVVTKARANVIEELGGKPALVQLQELLEELPPQDWQLVQSGVHVGLVMNEYQDRFERGDFLVRNVIGADPKSGAIAIADFVRPGQTVQFHVRDAQTADEDLRALLARVDNDPARRPRGGLLFTCNGRGTRLFAKPHHDASVLQDFFAELPLAGFFAQGELGPVGGRNFVHGFTASVVLFS
jgi:small ligand-binding sensory domain FIST